MPAEAVVDRMVVQLLGDAASYKQMMNEAKKITEETTRDMTGRLRDTRGRYVAEMKLMRAETDITLDKINKMLAEAHGPSQLTRDLEATHGSIKKLGVIAGHVGPQMEAFGKKMTIATLPLTLLGGLAIKVGSDFESGFAGVKKTIEATPEELAMMRQGFKDMLEEIPATQKELLGIGEAAGQLGVANENVLGFTKTISMMATTTNLSAEEAASSMARFANIMGMPQSQFENLGSTIVALGNTSAATEKDIVAMAMRLAGAGSTVGMSVPQVTALATALSEVGIEAEMGGSALSTFMLDVTSDVATGSDNLQNFAQVARMSASEFAESWKKDATGTLVRLMEGLKSLDKEAKVKALRDMGVDSVRMTDAILRSSNAVDTLKKSLNTAETAFEANTALANEAKQRYETFDSQVQLLKNSFNNLLEETFQQMKPALLSIMRGVQGVVDWFRQLSPTTKQVMIVMASLLVTVGPLSLAFGKLMLLFRLTGPIMKFGSAIKWTIESIGGLTTALGQGSLAMGAFKAGLVAAVIVAIVMAAKAIYNAMPSIKQWNAEIERGKKLNEEMAAAQSERTQDTIAEAAAISDLGEREKFLKDALAMAQKDASGLNSQFNHMKKEVEENDTVLKRWSGNKILEGMKMELSDVETGYMNAKDRVKVLQKALNELNAEKDRQAKAEFEASEAMDLEKQQAVIDAEKKRQEEIQETIDLLREQAATHGMTEQELLAYKLTMMGVVEGTDQWNEAMAEQIKLDQLKARMEEEKRAAEDDKKKADNINSMVNSLKEEVKVLGKTREEVELMRLAEAGASAEQIESVKQLQAQRLAFEEAEKAKEDSKEATEEAADAEKKFRDSLKAGGIEGVGRGMEALARVQEARSLRRTMDVKTEEKSIAAAKPMMPPKGSTTFSTLLGKPEKSEAYLAKIAAATETVAKKDPVEFKAAGIGT